jgi:hypothetical protein
VPRTGHLLGINTAIATSGDSDSRAGVAFPVPIRTVNKLIRSKQATVGSDAVGRNA